MPSAKLIQKLKPALQNLLPPEQDGILLCLDSDNVTGDNAKYMNMYNRLARWYDFGERWIARLRYGNSINETRRSLMGELEWRQDCTALYVSIGTGTDLNHLPADRPRRAGLDRCRPVARHVGTLPRRVAEKSGRLGLGTLQRRRFTLCRQYVRRRIPCGRHQFFQRQTKSHQRNAARRQARHQNHDCRRNHRLHPTTIQKKPIHAELLPRHRFRPDTNRKLHPRNRTGKENAAAVEQPLLLHHLPQTCLKQALRLFFQTASKSEKAV